MAARRPPSRTEFHSGLADGRRPVAHLDQMEQMGQRVTGPLKTAPLDALGELDQLVEKLATDGRLDGAARRRLESAMMAALDHGETRSVIHELLHSLARGRDVAVTSSDEDLSPTQAAERLGISRKLVNKMLEAGDMRFHRLPQSRHKRIPASEVIRVLRERERVSAGIDAIMDAVADAEY